MSECILSGRLGPKGDKGDTGAKGAKGDTGAAGAAGANGSDATAGIGIFHQTVSLTASSTDSSGNASARKTFTIPTITYPTALLLYTYTSYTNQTSTFVPYVWSSKVDAAFISPAYGNYYMSVVYRSGTQFDVMLKYYSATGSNSGECWAIFIK